MNQEEYLRKLYSNRFDHKQIKAKSALWKTLIECFLQKHVGQNSVILDIGGGYCEFINQVQGREKYLIDLNPDSKIFADPDVNLLNINILNSNEQKLLNKRFDRIFISNFFEHLRNKEELIEVLVLTTLSLAAHS